MDAEAPPQQIFPLSPLNRRPDPDRQRDALVHAMLEETEGEESGGAEEVLNTGHFCFVSRDKWAAATFTAEARNAAGLDSCCSKSIMGLIWFNNYLELLPEEHKKLVKGPYPTDTNFLFGGGEQKDSMGRYLLPVELHGCQCRI